MIEIGTKIHDRYSIEFKMGFVANSKEQERDFSVGMWIFVPESLDITPTTFTKKEFYRCVKSNVRLKTPVFRLSEIVPGPKSPFRNVLDSPADEYEYRLKMFCTIVNSALRDAVSEIRHCSDISTRQGLCAECISSCNAILDSYYSLADSTIHAYCGEFLCNRIAGAAFKVMSFSSDGSAADLLRRIYNIRSERGYAQIEADAPDGNSAYMHRNSVLKKMVESELYLRVPKKRDGLLVEQAYYSLAAGMAMIFATVVAWAFQRTFGNLTWPLFLALIISYMMKDRIKELMRFYFAHRLSDRYYDNKARIDIRGKKIGWLKEAMDFIPSGSVPQDIDKHRNAVHLFSAEDGTNRENVILYRKRVKLDENVGKENLLYDFNGINDIVRIQVRPFLRKMDNPVQMTRMLADDGTVQKIPCARDYYINIILRYQYGGNTEFKRFRITLNRDGVKSITPVE